MLGRESALTGGRELGLLFRAVVQGRVPPLFARTGDKLGGSKMSIFSFLGEDYRLAWLGRDIALIKSWFAELLKLIRFAHVSDSHRLACANSSEFP